MGTDTFTFGADAASSVAVDDTIFVNGLGPMRVTTVATTAVSCSNNLDQEAGGDYFEEFASDAASSLIPAFKVVATTDVAAGDILLMDGRRYKVAAVGDTTGGTTNGKVTLTETYAGGKNGHPVTMYEFTGQTKALYKVLNGMGYKPFEITESVTGSTYQYVSQCANRGSCDSSSGICKCFKGYSNDNCDTQNMLAA